MHLLPAIDLRGGRVVRLTQGDYNRQTVYADDPLPMARAFENAFAQAGVSPEPPGGTADFEQTGPRWLHVVDLEAAKTGQLSSGTRSTLSRIVRETTLSVEFGGGVRTTDLVDELLALGVRRTVVGSAALRDWPWFASLFNDADRHGRIALGLDARDGIASASGWTESSGQRAVEIAQRAAEIPGLGAIIYTDIATDGTLQGPNLQATRDIAEIVAESLGPGGQPNGSQTGPQVIASGGVGTLDHLRQLATLPIHGVIVGRALYERTIGVADAIAALARRPSPTPGTPSQDFADS